MTIPGYYWLRDTVANEKPNPFIAYNDGQDWYFPCFDQSNASVIQLADSIQDKAGNLLPRYQNVEPVATAPA